MKDVDNLAELQHIVSKVGLVVVHFWAPWCEPCSLLDQVLTQLCKDKPEVQPIRVQAEEAAAISEKFGVSAVPLFIFFRSGQEVDRLEGADPAELTSKFELFSIGTLQNSKQLESTTVDEQKQAQTLHLEKLMTQQPVMLFMKGTPDAPRCGFSAKVVSALNSNSVEFGYFDILSDEAVRQGLKEVSKWPTYPQLYCKGELIGGCDIVLELAEAGELKNELA